MAAHEKFAFSLQELVYFVTFLSVVLGLTLRAEDEARIVLLNGTILALICFLRGAWLYKWTIVGACATHSAAIFLYAASDKSALIEPSDLLQWSIVAMTLGATAGVIIALGPRRETSPIVLLALSVTIVVDICWFLLPNVQ